MKRSSGSSISRRTVLLGTGLLGLDLAFSRCSESMPYAPDPRRPGAPPNPALPEGTDTLPQIEHIIILMMENHSFDNYFGMLDPSVGFALQNGRPTATNPDGQGHLIRAFRMPSSCQATDVPHQRWVESHMSYADGRNDGFVLASGPVAMGYWTAEDIPFYYGLAKTFCLSSRWFSSTLCQTYPNRRFLLAGTAAGIITSDLASVNARQPPAGNIFQRLDAHGISWRNYSVDVPSLALFLNYALQNNDKLFPVEQFLRDAAAGTLPAVSLIDPAYRGPGSEENPDDIHIGENFAAQMINAAMSGPAWSRTLLVWLYDEGGGYYDHVPPPRAVPPDDIPPALPEGSPPGAYDRYGFRVPAVIVSPYARRGYVSDTVRDHTSVLKFIERKWNLPALTWRDAQADDLMDCLDFENPSLLTPPELPLPALLAGRTLDCMPGKPGQIPPPDAVLPAPPGLWAGRRALPRPSAPRQRVGEPLAEVWYRFHPHWRGR